MRKPMGTTCLFAVKRIPQEKKGMVSSTWGEGIPISTAQEFPEYH